MRTEVFVAIDTNVLAYAEGTNGPAMKWAALDILSKLSPESTLIPVQALGELFAVLVKKARRSREQAQAAVLSWGDTFPLLETTPEVILSAMCLAAEHQLGWWDSVVLSAAAEARCRLLLSEDLQEGFTWRGVTVTNPFSATRHTLFDAMMK